MFRPNLDENWAGTKDTRAAIFLEGDHPEVAHVPVAGTSFTTKVGETYSYLCPFTGERRTLWAVKGRSGDVLKIVDAFARDNAPVPAAAKFIAERVERTPVRH